MYSKNSLIVKSVNNFISLPAFYLIMWLMKVKKNFEKIAILKTRELVFFWVVKTHFGKIAPNDAFSGIKKKDFNHYYVVAFDPNKIYTHWVPQNDRLNLSFVKDVYVVAKKWPEIVKKCLFLRLKFFLQNWKTQLTEFVISAIAFNPIMI